ncbi:Ku protein [Catenulispora yoronensis]
MPSSKVWSGSISFGLVNVPVGLYSATEDKSVHFHRYHEEDGGRIRQKRVCEVDGEELATEDIARGYELPDGDTVVMTDADFEGLPVPTLKAITVEAFVPEEQIDPIMFSSSYYLVPDKAGARAYALLRDAIEKAGKTALVKIAIRERERLAAIRVREEILVLETMYWPDEIRPAVDIPESDPKRDEVAAAQALIDQMTVDFDPEQYTDHYREALLEAIEAKAKGREVITPPAPKDDEGGAKVLDLMAALKASVEQAKKTREEPPAEPKKRAPAHPKGEKKAAKSAKPAKTAKTAKSAARKSA